MQEQEQEQEIKIEQAKQKKVKIWVLSDLHLEFYKNNTAKLWRVLCKQTPFLKEGKGEEEEEAQNAEILVLAGDIGVPILPSGKRNKAYGELLAFFRKRFKHVILVSGNHEYYCKSQPTEVVDAVLSSIATENGVHFLQQSSVSLEGIRFLGCTLRSDANLAHYKEMRDSSYVSWQEHTDIHRSHRVWLEQELAIARANHDFDTPVVVVTHHLPSQVLVHTNNITTERRHHTGYYTNLDDMINENKSILRLWICGHSHEFMHVLHHNGGTELYLNPSGYPNDPRATRPSNEPLELEVRNGEGEGEEEEDG